MKGKIVKAQCYIIVEIQGEIVTRIPVRDMEIPGSEYLEDMDTIRKMTKAYADSIIGHAIDNAEQEMQRREELINQPPLEDKGGDWRDFLKE